jgi:alcohol dehydrogenase class IV
VLTDLGHLDARDRLRQAAWPSDVCLANTKMGPHHHLAHAVGGTFDLPHAEVHATLLGHAVRFQPHGRP